jgi:hypothetical protein
MVNDKKLLSRLANASSTELKQIIRLINRDRKNKNQIGLKTPQYKSGIVLQIYKYLKSINKPIIKYVRKGRAAPSRKIERIPQTQPQPLTQRISTNSSDLDKLITNEIERRRVGRAPSKIVTNANAERDRLKLIDEQTMAKSKLTISEKKIQYFENNDELRDLNSSLGIINRNITLLEARILKIQNNPLPKYEDVRGLLLYADETVSGSAFKAPIYKGNNRVEFSRLYELVVSGSRAKSLKAQDGRAYALSTEPFITIINGIINEKTFALNNQRDSSYIKRETVIKKIEDLLKSDNVNKKLLINSIINLPISDEPEDEVKGEGDSYTGVLNNTAISNIEIDEELKESDSFRTTYMRDEEYPNISGKQNDKTQSFIINMDNMYDENGILSKGSHWVSVYMDVSNAGKMPTIEYYDSLGEGCPENIYQKLLTSSTIMRRFKENLVKNQHSTTMNCGRFAVEFIKKRDLNQSFKSITGFKQQDNSTYMEKRFNTFVGKGVDLNIGDEEEVLGGNIITDVAYEGWLRLKILLLGRTAFPKSVRDIISKYGNWFIDSPFYVCRSPIFSSISRFANLITFGKFKKKVKALNYDEVFHLFTVLKLTNPENHSESRLLRIEKNEVIKFTFVDYMNMGEVFEITQQPDVRNSIDTNGNKSIEFINNPTLGTIMKIGIDRDGPNFIRYSGDKYNCQRFIMSVLSDYMTPALKSFVLQDAGALFDSLPLGSRSLAQWITDSKARWSGIFGSGC